MTSPLLTALATELLPHDCVARLLENREAIEAELARALERNDDTERCVPQTEPAGPTLLVDIVDGEPVSLLPPRVPTIDGMARLVALAGTHCPALTCAPLLASRRTTIHGRDLDLPVDPEVLEVLERLMDDMRDEPWDDEETAPDLDDDDPRIANWEWEQARDRDPSARQP